MAKPAKRGAGVSDAANDVSQPKVRRSLSPIKRLLPFLLRYPWRLGLTILFLLVAAISSLAIPALAGGLIDQGAPQFYPFNAGADQGLDFPGGSSRTSGEGAHFCRYHGKTAALFTGPCCFDGRIQCQDVGLKRNAVDDTDDVGNLA